MEIIISPSAVLKTENPITSFVSLSVRLKIILISAGNTANTERLFKPICFAIVLLLFCLLLAMVLSEAKQQQKQINGNSIEKRYKARLTPG
ncbi:hypothetical protein AQ505_14255 [Pedobacter sp. PACM 27299]|uniref:hypothetical protein n=1 Tax=Pedobacter sp. PACM 27299 TaxID=1727164 RepID=UPI0007064E87|nr:hypothetical protein [Pedobacter sp. PACM 27299]ALL06559.1 hypothetical protein AQ505_14255 [Pedobacter sp. PACM 27299]